MTTNLESIIETFFILSIGLSAFKHCWANKLLLNDFLKYFVLMCGADKANMDIQTLNKWHYIVGVHNIHYLTYVPPCPMYLFVHDSLQ